MTTTGNDSNRDTMMPARLIPIWHQMDRTKAAKSLNALNYFKVILTVK